MIPSLNDLCVAPLDRLILHEAHDGNRLALLAERIRDEGVQRHPVIISPQGDDYLVLDGAHRVQALKDLGCKFILAQEVEPPKKAESWGHLLKIPERLKLYEVENAEFSGSAADSWVAEIEFADGERVFVGVREPGLAEEVEGLWGLQKLYPEGGVVHRVDPDATVELAEDEVIIRYRTFKPEELVEVVGSGAVLPAGITRFRARERVLGVRFPLDKLENGVLKERNAELRMLVEERWSQNRVRYYGEPVVLFE
ncbi:MAG: ParB N-terminal domain-containing protein [Actinomycetota bacterium]|nr:ParB N-terminal domain-containing protein [Actinomycetota bacterium]